MKVDPGIFVRAADLIQNEKRLCCCPAIYSSGDESLAVAADDAFCRLYRPDGAYRCKPWWAGEWQYGTRLGQEARIIALLLAAEIAKEAHKCTQ